MTSDQLDALAERLGRMIPDKDLIRMAYAIIQGEQGTWRALSDQLAAPLRDVNIDDACLALVRRIALIASRAPKTELIAEMAPFLFGLLHWHRATCPHFALAPDLFHALSLTEYVRAEDPKPLKLPFRAFTIAFPSSPLLGNASRIFVYPLARVTSTTSTQLSWPLYRCTLYPEGEPIFTQWDDGITLGQFTADCSELDELPVRGGVRPLEGREKGFMRPARVLVANLLAYIEAKGPLPQTATGPRPAPLERAHPRRSTWDVGRTVKLDANIRRALIAAASGANHARWKLAQRYIVRGHWRQQPHGEGRALRKDLWIEPHWRGPADIETVLQRTYEVGRAKD